jgi:hypothetical protein
MRDWVIYQIIQSLVYFRQNRMVSRRKFLAAFIALCAFYDSSDEGMEVGPDLGLGLSFDGDDGGASGRNSNGC